MSHLVGGTADEHVHREVDDVEVDGGDLVDRVGDLLCGEAPGAADLRLQGLHELQEEALRHVGLAALRRHGAQGLQGPRVDHHGRAALQLEQADLLLCEQPALLEHRPLGVAEGPGEHEVVDVHDGVGVANQQQRRALGQQAPGDGREPRHAAVGLADVLEAPVRLGEVLPDEEREEEGADRVHGVREVRQHAGAPELLGGDGEGEEGDRRQDQVEAKEGAREDHLEAGARPAEQHHPPLRVERVAGDANALGRRVFEPRGPEGREAIALHGGRLLDVHLC
mmetsp:Transcript_68884/g.201704  ORF Transcript_68884/g.201704 Transcript_68884/m.201704 type:complete len:281 (+) Transcript_68884:555-1397(+)